MAGAFPPLVYLLCVLTSGACALLLARSYWRTGTRLLLWSALCFVLLAATHLVVMLDLLVLPERDFRLARHLLSLGAVGVLLFGFVWDTED